MAIQIKSQWDCVLQNLGEWQGSFSLFSPQGVLLEDIPSLISLSGVDENRSIHLVLKRFYLEPESGERVPKEIVVDFSAPGAGALFFESGAFSDGSVYYAPQGSFGSEFCFVDGDPYGICEAARRLRLVMLFSGGCFSRLTLIREQRVGTDAPENETLKREDLLGAWRGESVTRYVGRAKVDQAEGQQPGISSADREGYQMVLLPDGGWVGCPEKVVEGQPFFLEAGWLHAASQMQLGSPRSRQRLVRQYNERGEWVSVTWITEQKIG
jgi:Domain of unknown function (DUF3598)